jgi:branched-subunit amino acid transport protein
MSVWIVVAAVGIGTVVLKGAGPALLGGRPLPERLNAVVALLAPTLLAALVVTQTVGDRGGVAADPRLVGVGAAGVTIALRAPLLVVVVVAAAATAFVRAFA